MKPGNRPQEVVDRQRGRAIDSFAVQNGDVRGDFVGPANHSIGRYHDGCEPGRFGTRAFALFGYRFGSSGGNDDGNQGDRHRNIAQQRAYSTFRTMSGPSSAGLSNGGSSDARMNRGSFTKGS